MKNNGYTINKALTTYDKGIDIEAIHPEKGLCFVEAKGETSSKKETNRFNKPFSLKQIKTHIGVAIVKAFQIKQNNKEALVIIALPDCLFKTEIKIFFVKDSGNVEEYSNNIL